MILFIRYRCKGKNKTRKSCSCETALRMQMSWMGIADHAKKAEKLSIAEKPVAEVLVEGIWSWNNNSRISFGVGKAEVFFMFLKLSFFKIGLIFEKADPFGNTWMSCDPFKIWMGSLAEIM